MAQNLAASQHKLIRDIILSRSVTTTQMADVAGCSERSIRYIRSNLRLFGSVRAPPNKPGRPRTVTSPMLDALCEHLLTKSDLYLDEMEIFLWDEFGTVVTNASIRRALRSVSWSKAARRIAGERNADLRDY